MANKGARLRPVEGQRNPSYREMFNLDERELQVFASLTERRDIFVRRSNGSAMVLRVNYDPNALWEYANSPQENYDRQQREALQGIGKEIT